MVWMCDRCSKAVKPQNRANKSPDGWATVRLQPNRSHQARNWLLCIECLNVFVEAMDTKEEEEE